MPSVFAKCPVCQYAAYRDAILDRDIYIVDCLRCGYFRITEEGIMLIDNRYSEKNRLLASSKINESNEKKYVFMEDDIKTFLTISAPSIDERATYLLLCFADHFPQIGTGPSMSDMEHFLGKGHNLDETDFKDPIAKFVLQSLSRSYCPNKDELDYLITDYHIDESKFITLNNYSLEISPKGWARLDEMKIKIKESNIGFIAMKFSDNLIKYSKQWFESAITSAGYEAKAMYNHKHTNIIDNEMKALIRRSKFLVCDLTLSSKGAYYEAGFAHGLDIPVIFLCKKEFFDKKENELSGNNEGVHFDTNHYPIILWEKDDGDRLKKELKNWIEGTIGRGLLI